MKFLTAKMQHTGALLLGMGLVALVACSSDREQASPTPGTTSSSTTSRTPVEKLVDSSQQLDNPRELMDAAFGELSAGERTGERVREVVRKMGESGNTSYIPVLTELLLFVPRLAVLSSLGDLIGQPYELLSSEQRQRSWWIRWLANHPEVQPPDGFAAWKGQLFSLIDPRMGDFIYNGVKTGIRLEEIVWGGVRKDGIPDLTNPPAVSGKEAGYLRPSDRVFGVSINGEHRAYPLRILNAHEMANDVVGGVPFALAY